MFSSQKAEHFGAGDKSQVYEYFLDTGLDKARTSCFLKKETYFTFLRLFSHLFDLWVFHSRICGFWERASQPADSDIFQGFGKHWWIRKHPSQVFARLQFIEWILIKCRFGKRCIFYIQTLAVVQLGCWFRCVRPHLWYKNAIF